jgi:predicted CxxxxCH...CXXCH cytochrome family protein
MKQTKLLWIFLGLLLLALLVVMTSCKTEREQSALGPHPTGWMDASSANFHGIPAQRDSSNNCRACHGEDLTGGTSGVSCAECHLALPHPPSWTDTSSAGFHGLVARTDSGRMCEACHGVDFRGGLSGVSCFDCHSAYPHIENTNWAGPVTADTTFHGWTAMSTADEPGQSCKPCHGADFHGTTRAQSCYDCHTSLHTDVTNANITTHRAFVADKSWNIVECQTCHGSDYTGGAALAVNGAANCTQCHLPSDTARVLTGCNVCHTTDPGLRDFWKVPYGMDSTAAGAHPTHVTEQGFSCRECHPSLSAAGHPHALPGGVAFVEGRTRFANLYGEQPTSTHLGAANSGDATCSNVYCHSTGLHSNPGPPVTFPPWRDHLTCGACHGIPPTPADDPGHPQDPHDPEVRVCSNCHADIDPTSNFSIPDSIRFIADSLHVDNNYHL